MNERIKELAHKAGLPTYNPDSIPTKLEKFAELIVRECATKVDWILADGGKTQGDLIKEHFGIDHRPEEN